MAATTLIEKGFSKEDIYKPAGLKSVAQLEKLGQKGQVAALLGDLIVRPDGEPKLVKDNADAKEDFQWALG